MIMPYFWIALLITIVMMSCAIKIKNKKIKLIISNLVFIPLILLVSEGFSYVVNVNYIRNNNITTLTPNFYNSQYTINK